MSLRAAVPLLLMSACSDLETVPGYLLASDAKDASVEERDERIEVELRAQMNLSFGKCDALFEAYPSYGDVCPDNPFGLGHELLRTPGYFDGNYNSAQWEFCEYQDGKKVEYVSVRGWCADFIHSNGNPGWHPSAALPDLALEEGLKKELPRYSYK